jgi:regulator of replication initiation timing
MEEKTVDAIHRLMLEMGEVRNKVKTVRDQLKDVMEQNDEYRTAQEELKEYKQKRELAKKALDDDKDYHEPPFGDLLLRDAKYPNNRHRGRNPPSCFKRKNRPSGSHRSKRIVFRII